MLEKINRLLKMAGLPSLPDGTCVEQYCDEYVLTRGEAIAYVPRTSAVDKNVLRAIILILRGY